MLCVGGTITASAYFSPDSNGTSDKPRGSERLKSHTVSRKNSFTRKGNQGGSNLFKSLSGSEKFEKKKNMSGKGILKVHCEEDIEHGNLCYCFTYSVLS